MTTLITGSSGHLGEAIARVLDAAGKPWRGIDIKPGDWTHHVGHINDPEVVAAAMRGVDTVFHTATLHKPHVETHSIADFIDTNVAGTNVLLDAAKSAGVRAFVFTSTTSVFGEAMRPAPDKPAVWVTESIAPIPKNIYGMTKVAAEELCRLYHQRDGMNCIVLRTSRFFPEEDDNRERRDGWDQNNVKANEFLYCRVDLADCVDAQLAAAERAPALGFGRYIISATTPYRPEDLDGLGSDAASVTRARVPDYESMYQRLGWRLFDRIDKVYDNAAARRDLGWAPRLDFGEVLNRLDRGENMVSDLAIAVGKKGYHDRQFEDGPYPVS